MLTACGWSLRTPCWEDLTCLASGFWHPGLVIPVARVHLAYCCTHGACTGIAAAGWPYTSVDLARQATADPSLADTCSHTCTDIVQRMFVQRTQESGFPDSSSNCSVSSSWQLRPASRANIKHYERKNRRNSTLRQSTLLVSSRTPDSRPRASTADALLLSTLTCRQHRDQTH